VSRSLKSNSRRAEAFSNHARIQRSLGHHEDAITSCNKALELNPWLLDALVLRGNALHDLDRPEEAFASVEAALAINSGYFVALAARGDILAALGRHDEALACCDRALAIRPDYVEARYNRACRLLAMGRLEEGWPGYEHRYDIPSFGLSRPVRRAAEWTGDSLHGKSILIHSEQGFGDTIQCIRYLPSLVQRGARVTFLVARLLHRLLRPFTNDIALISELELEPARAFDVECSLMSLPFRFNTGLSTIPGQVPYLLAEDELTTRWRARIGPGGFKVGICWQGNPLNALDRGRSPPLAHFAALARIPDVRIISLQTHYGLDQLRQLPAGMTVETLGDDFGSGPDAFVDAAAAMNCVDLIVTSDTASAHLAGALARPTWLILRHVPDWRWLLERDDSPWYPHMRLFRQPVRGDFDAVFRKMADELAGLAAAAGH
jgi:hypothetical protein